MTARIILLGAALIPAVFAQPTYYNVYSGTVITGSLQLTTTINLSRLSTSSLRTFVISGGTEQPRISPRLPLPPHFSASAVQGQSLPRGQSLAISSAAAPNMLKFDALTHQDQRLANSGNQFSLEPPNPSIATANGMVLEGVNDAVRVYTTSGTPLTGVIASNQLFGLAPTIDRSKTPNVYGVYTTDMRVFFDQDISRWFVVQRAQDEDSSGNPLNSSHLYMAVSQTSDPTANYNIYVIDTTNASNPGCPCFDDYPQIGADHYGFYISSNEYFTGVFPYDPTESFPSFNDVAILTISKADLAAGTASPRLERFVAPFFSGFEFAIQPATTPPGASQFVASGGAEFLVSSSPFGANFNPQLALWAFTNTASLQSAAPNLTLTQAVTVSTLPYYIPPDATQLSGPLTLGAAMGLEELDGGSFSDTRVLSTVYSGGRLFVTLASAVLDAQQNVVAGGYYGVFSPLLRNGTLSALAPMKQGYIAATGNHILRPVISVNAVGRGALAFTLSGPSYFPSAAFASIDITTAPPSAIQVVGAGAGPEDGFSGYGPIPGVCPTCNGFGVARWGDYSTAVTSTDGSIWMVSEYIPNDPRTPLANWGTFISEYLP